MIRSTFHVGVIAWCWKGCLKISMRSKGPFFLALLPLSCTDIVSLMGVQIWSAIRKSALIPFLLKPGSIFRKDRIVSFFTLPLLFHFIFLPDRWDSTSSLCPNATHSGQKSTKSCPSLWPSIRGHYQGPHTVAVILFPVRLLKPTTLALTYRLWAKIVTKMCLREKKPHITILNSLILVPDSVPGQMMHATVRNLSPWVDYEFRVVAINSIGVGEPSTHTKQIRTKAAGTLWLSRFSLCWFNHNRFPIVIYLFGFLWCFRSVVSSHVKLLNSSGWTVFICVIIPKL